MKTAQFVISIDVGSTYIKGALLQADSDGQQQLVASTIAPAMLVEQTLTSAISQLRAIAKKKNPAAETPDLVIVGHPPDIPEFTKASSVSKLSHEEALTTVVKRLSSSGTVVAIDVGSRRTMAAMGRFGKTTIESFPYGIGIEMWNVLRRQFTTDQVRQWMSYDVPNEEIENYVANKSIYPHLIPATPIEQAIEQTVAKLILRKIAHELSFPWSDIQQIVLSGAVLTQPAIASQSMMVMLDGLQPMSSVHVFADTTATIYACGGAFDFWQSKDYRVARGVLRQTLTPLGTAIAFSSDETGRQKAAKIMIDSGLSTEQSLDVRQGEIVAIPMSEMDAAQIEVKTSNKLPTKTEQEPEIAAMGGQVGLIIDGRNRPIVLKDHDRERRQQLKIWEKQLDIHQRVGEIGVYK